MIEPYSLRRSSHEWASLRTELVWIYDQMVAPKFRHHATVDGRTGYWARYVRAGQITLTDATRVISVGPGEWITGARERGTFNVTDDTHIVSIQFFCQWPTGDNFFGKTGLRVIKNSECPELIKKAEQLERHVRKLQGEWTGYERERPTYSDFLRRQSLFLDWLGTWCDTLVAQGCQPALGCDDERLARVARQLNEAPLARGFPKARLCAEAKLSPGQLDIKFAQAFGMSPWRHWERRRFEHAKRRLSQTEILVKQIAYETGFKTDAHFVAWFRRLTGDSPGRFRMKPAREQ